MTDRVPSTNAAWVVLPVLCHWPHLSFLRMSLNPCCLVDSGSQIRVNERVFRLCPWSAWQNLPIVGAAGAAVNNIAFALARALAYDPMFCSSMSLWQPGANCAPICASELRQ